MVNSGLCHGCWMVVCGSPNMFLRERQSVRSKFWAQWTRCRLVLAWTDGVRDLVPSCRGMQTCVEGILILMMGSVWTGFSLRRTYRKDALLPFTISECQTFVSSYFRQRWTNVPYDAILCEDVEKLWWRQKDKVKRQDTAVSTRGVESRGYVPDTRWRFIQRDGRVTYEKI